MVIIFMKICVIGLRGFPDVQGGVEKHCEFLYGKLQQDFNFSVFRRKPYLKRMNDNDVRFEKIEFIDLPSTKIKGFESLLHSFISTIYVAFTGCDIVHYHNIGPAVFSPILKIINIPILLTYHSANYEHEKWGFLAKKFLKFCEWVSLSCADRIIFVNKFQMEKYSDDIRKKSIYIPNGVDFRNKSENDFFLKKFGLNDSTYILAVGRLTPEKGFDVLTKAFNIASLDNIKLVIAGASDNEPLYQDALIKNSNGNIIFTGYANEEELNQLYSNAALFVLPSYNEGFPLVLLEAMSFSLDVLVSDIPATRILCLDEDCYFQTGNYEQLASKISERLKFKKNYNYNLSMYNWNHVAKQTAMVYNLLERD